MTLPPMLPPEQTRRFWVETLEKLAGPVLANLAAGRLRERMPVALPPGAEDNARRRHRACLEAVGRLLCGIAPFLDNDAIEGEAATLRDRLLHEARLGLDRATHPDSPDGMDFEPPGQPLVDAAFLAQALLRGRASLWDPLEQTVKRNILQRLRQTREIRPIFNNWLLFSAMVEAFFAAVGEPFDRMRIDYAVRQHEQWYLGGGVDGDGPHYAGDYYNSYVIQPMLLDVLEAVAPVDDAWESFRPAMAHRAVIYAVREEQMIGPDGAYPPIGRSIAYRCGAFQTLADRAWRRKLPAALPPAQAREALTAVIRRTLHAPGTFDDDGWLRIGLAGHQPTLGDRYICTGSCYLASFVLLPLGLPPADPFWADSPQPWTSRRLWQGEDTPRPKPGTPKPGSDA